MFRASSAHLQEDTVGTHAAYVTVTLYASFWWPVGTQLEWELTVGGRLLVGVLRHPPTVQYAACVQLYPPEDEHLRLETCRGEEYFMNK